MNLTTRIMRSAKAAVLPTPLPSARSEPPPESAGARRERLRQVEIGRLAILLQRPSRYIQRRVETFRLVDDHHYAVAVTQQFTVAGHGSMGTSEHPLMIPVGFFAKERLADLRVHGPDGTILPVLSRWERASVTAVIFSQPFEHQLKRRVPAEHHDIVRAVVQTIQNRVAKLTDETPDAAKRIADDLLAALRTDARNRKFPRSVRKALRWLTYDKGFTSGLRAFQKVRLIIALMRGEVDQTYTIEAHYTERFNYELELRRIFAPRRIREWGPRLVRLFLVQLGWVTVEIRQDAANFGRALSHWIVQSVPTGVEPVRQYWDDRGDLAELLVDETVENDRAITARYAEPVKPGQDRTLILEVQMAPSAAVLSAALLALALCAVATFIFQSNLARHQTDIKDSLIALATIFAAVPAAITGALAYQGQTFVRRVSRGPRLALALLSLQAAILAIEISLKRVTVFTAHLSLVLAVYSYVVFWIFVYIQFGPRFRKSIHCRVRWIVGKFSPRRCAELQVRWATLAIVLLALTGVEFAHLEEALRHVHFFAPDFPENIWKGVKSWPF